MTGLQLAVVATPALFLIIGLGLMVSSVRYSRTTSDASTGRTFSLGALIFVVGLVLGIITLNNLL